MSNLDYKQKRRIRNTAIVVIILLLLLLLLFVFTRGNKTTEAAETLDNSIGEVADNNDDNNATNNTISDSNETNNSTNNIVAATTTVTTTRTPNRVTTTQTNNNAVVADTPSNNGATTVTLIKPTVNLNGETNITVEYKGEFEDPGIEVQDGTVTTEVYFAEKSSSDIWEKVEGVDTASLGVYNIYYTIFDNEGNKVETVKRTVSVNDTVLPTADVTVSNEANTNEDVTVTIKASEALKEIAGWTKVDDTTFTKTFSENVEETITVEDLAGNKLEVSYKISNIDKTVPTVEVATSNDSKDTNQDVTVTIKASEAIKEIAGWTKVDDKTFTKTFSENVEETITVEDISGNKTEVSYKVEGIDKVAATAEVTTSNDSKDTNQDVTVTIKASEALKEIAGWTKVDDTTFTKAFSENVAETILTIEDLAGNKAEVSYKVEGIDKVAATAEVTTSNNGKRTNQDVIVTIKASEALKEIAEWTKVDDTTFTKVFSENVAETILTIEDLAGNKTDVAYTVADINKVKPEAKSVDYSTTERTNQNVVVTITATKPILVPEGWERGNRAYKIVKEYEANVDEVVTIKDLYGNENTVNVKIENINKIKPEAKSVDYSTTEITNQNVVVTITATKPILVPEGWERGNRAYKIVKEYEANVDEVITIKDLYGNENTVNVKIENIDKTAPVHTSLRITTTGKAGYAKVGDTINVYAHFEEDLEVLPKLKINGTYETELTSISKREGYNIYYKSIKLTETDGIEDGLVNIEVYGYEDKAGNVGKTLTNADFTLTSQSRVIVDKTAPVHTSLRITTTGKAGYAKVGDTINVYAHFEEDLEVLPKLKINGKYETTLNSISKREGYNIYYKSIKLIETDGIEDGLVNIEVYGYEDKAGNVGRTLTNADFTLTSQSRVIVDKTAPVHTSLRITTTGKAGFAKVGDTINVYAHFEEDLGVLPKLKINGTYETELTSISKREGYNIYYKSIKLTETDGIEDGLVNIEVYGYEDKAGNVGRTLTNADFTLTSQSRVIVDKTAPVHTSLRITTTGKAGFAKVGDTINVYAHFEEDLAVLPKLKINGKYEATLNSISKKEGYNIYYKSIKLTETDGIEDGLVNIEVYGYEDKAGNVGRTLTNADFTLTSQSKVTVDKTAPELMVKEESTGTDPHYSKISFKLTDNYLIDYFEINGTKYDRDNTKWSDANYQNIKDSLIEGENKIILYDVAGNKIEKTFYMDWTKPTIEVKEYIGKEPNYSGMSFKLFDNNLIDYFEVNGTKYDRTNAKVSDANYQNIKNSLKNGKNTLVLYDAAGNSTTYTFNLERIAPTINVSEGTVGTGPYSKLNLKMYDASGIASVEINGTKLAHTGYYVDINDGHAYTFLEGENTVVVTDNAGNVTTQTFVVDRTHYVTTFADLKAAFEKGGKVKLQNNIVVEETLIQKAGINIVLDMNEKKLTLKDVSVDPMIDMKKDSSIVITGNGTVDLEDNYHATFIIPRGDVTIENGNFLKNTGGTDYGTMFAGIKSGKGKLIIKDGYFDAGYYKEGDEFNNSRNGVNISWGQYVRVYGGTFVGQNPAYGDEGMAKTNPATTSGYCQGVMFEGQSWTDTEIPSTYTVTKGTHADGRPTFKVTYNPNN